MPLNVLNIPMIYENHNMRKTGNLQVVRVSKEIPCSEPMWKSMTILEFKMDLNVFTDEHFDYQEGHLRLFSEFFNPFECYVDSSIVQEMAMMSAYQVISMTGSMY